MMQIMLTRNWKKPDYTIGRIFINNAFFCNSMEPIDRGLRQDMPIEDIKRLKVKNKTAIPTGTYKVMMTWSPKYQKKMPQIMNVPCFDGVRFHPGNKPKDTRGCVLPGENSVKGMVVNSTKYFNQFVSMLEGSGGIATLVIQ